MVQQSEALPNPAVAGERSRVLAGVEDRKHLRGTPGFWRRAWRRFRRNKVAMVGLVLMCAIVIFCLSAGLISDWTGYSYSKTTLDVKQSLLNPGEGGHVLGTDK